MKIKHREIREIDHEDNVVKVVFRPSPSDRESGARTYRFEFSSKALATRRFNELARAEDFNKAYTAFILDWSTRLRRAA
jgi:hypothetical protein